jgi:hypothetical protein
MPTRTANPILQMTIMRLLRNALGPRCAAEIPTQSAMLFIFIAAISEVKLRHRQTVWRLLAVRPGSPQA